MDYGKIIGNSFKIAWRHKTLWLFGLFAGGGEAGYHFDDSWLERHEVGFDLEQFFQTWDLSFDWHLLIPIALALGILSLGFLVMHLISVPALIDGVNKIQRGGIYRLASSFSVGLDFFWRFLGLSLIAFVVILGVFLAAVAVGFISYAIHWGVLVFSILIMIPLLIGTIFGLVSTIELATRAMVVRNIGIFDSIHEGYLLLKRNLVSNILMFLIYIGLSIGLGIGAVIVWAIIGAPIALMALATGIGIIPSIILAAIIGLPVSLVVGGYIGTVLESLYTLFYFELVEPGGQAQASAPAAAAPMA